MNIVTAIQAAGAAMSDAAQSDPVPADATA
jgi:hypothetical protein